MLGLDRAWEAERLRGLELMQRSMARHGGGGIHYIPAAQLHQHQHLLQQQQIQLQLYQQQRIREKVTSNVDLQRVVVVIRVK